MSSIIKYLIVAIVAAAICFFFMRGCETSTSLQLIKDSLQQEIKANDSIKSESVKIGKDYDSLITGYNEYSVESANREDSLKQIISILQGKYSVTKDSVGTLYADLKTFYKDHDTVALAATYKNLAQQLNDENDQIFYIQIQRDSLDNVYTNHIALSDGVIDTLKGQNNQLQALLGACVVNSAATAKTATAAVKKAKTNSLLAKVGIGIAVILAGIAIHK